ncbi:MAG: hypothetical protein RRY29_05925 [Desulfovibrionaceae bacterium]
MTHACHHTVQSTRDMRQTRITWPIPLIVYETTTSPSTEYMLLMLSGALLLGIVLYGINWYHKKNVLEKGELLARPSVIRGVLTAALNARSRIDIFLATGERLTHPLTGCLEAIEPKTLFINLGSAQPPEKFCSLPLRLYFFLGAGHDKIFYSFDGNILSRRVTDGALVVEMPLPQLLTNAQKRDFVRICPGPGMLEALFFWKFALTPCAENLPDTAQNLGKVHFSYRPPKAVQVALVDISGGGARLRLAGSRLNETGIRFDVGDRCCLLVLLRDIETDELITVWLAGICRRFVRSPKSTNLDTGLQFTHWAQVKKIDNPIHWQAVQSDGEVPPILVWSLHTQTFLTRKVR